MSSLARLKRLETAILPAREPRLFVIPSTVRDGDVEAQKKRLRLTEGMTDDDRLIVIRRQIVSPPGATDSSPLESRAASVRL